MEANLQSADERLEVLTTLESIEAVFRKAMKARRAEPDTVIRWTNVLLPVRLRRA